ncbi:hypothetical protein KQI38_08160 [Tissierella carlieri]|jgi:hypothetical protein|uniref:hypothetical protein n=1 Tax=Tissierella carlieri TaxID=689904 RepID=UPI001C118488|nr:hypothetical protein [Tissierella carlieri]MBU5311997.1 hypothetical protein [Tissierella carlieri]MDU5083528.1 hypothetical protein [Bacillota bacterium]
MKSLNDIIWNEDIDLEDENNIEIQGMKEICLEPSCGLSPICEIRLSYHYPKVQCSA